MSILHIQGGRLIDPVNGVDEALDLVIESGKVKSVGKQAENIKATNVIDAKGLIVCPGLVELSTSLVDVNREINAALAGGITSFCCPPEVRLGGGSYKAHLYQLGALTQGLKGSSLSEMGRAKAAGCVGVTNGVAPVVDTHLLRRCYEYAATFGLKVFIQLVEPFLSRAGTVHEGAVSVRLGLTGIPDIAEVIELTTHLELVRYTGVAAHFGRLSCARSVELVKEAKKQGLPITADVAIHQLHLTEEAIEGFNTFAHVRPPFRTEADRQALLRGVREGVIDAVCADHQPHDFADKFAPFELTKPGISGLETLLSLSLDSKISLAALTSQPASILGIPAGNLAVGMPADICLFDPNKEWPVDKEQFLSAGHNTPFHGWKMKGKVVKTLLGGKVVYSL